MKLIANPGDDEESQTRMKEALESYLWSDVWQRIQGESLMRARLVDRVRKQIADNEKRLGMEPVNPRVNLEMIGKNNNNVGVVVIDMICHLCFRHCSKKPLASIESALIDKITIRNFDQ